MLLPERKDRLPVAGQMCDHGAARAYGVPVQDCVGHGAVGLVATAVLIMGTSISITRFWLHRAMQV